MEITNFVSKNDIDVPNDTFHQWQKILQKFQIISDFSNNGRKYVEKRWFSQFQLHLYNMKPKKVYVTNLLFWL